MYGAGGETAPDYEDIPLDSTETERGTERGTEGAHATECVYSGQHTEGEPDRVSG